MCTASYPLSNNELIMIDPITGQEAPDAGQAPAGDRLAELEGFFEKISPVLVKLNASPDMVQAILADKINDEFAKAALEGKLSVKEAEVATAAAKAVEAEVGTKAFNTASPDELSKLVEEKISALKNEWTEKDEMRAFEQSTNQFISETPDFSKYSENISKWLDDHDITDVRVAYYAVKGELSEKQAKEAADADAAENAKNMMLNASGGGISANATIGGQPFIDTLIGNRTNPNRF